MSDQISTADAAVMLHAIADALRVAEERAPSAGWKIALARGQLGRIADELARL